MCNILSGKKIPVIEYKGLVSTWLKVSNSSKKTDVEF